MYFLAATILQICLISVSAIPVDNGLVLKIRPSTTQFDTVCTPGVVDLLLVVDGSTSIGEENFEFVRRFLVSLVDDLPSESRVAAVQFSGTVRTEFYFDEYDTLEQIQDELSRLPYLRGTTRIANAIDYAVDTVLTENRGNRPNVGDIVIVITDGRSSEEPSAAAARLRNTGASVIAIGVTPFVDDDQLLAIAGENETVFKVEQFDQLDRRLKQNIEARMTCKQVPRPSSEEPQLDLECGPNSISIGADTENPFEGRVYVKGRHNEDECRADASVFNRNRDRSAGIVVLFDSCGTVRTRSLNPRGIFVETTVVFQFHPSVLTKVDRAFKIQCFYMEADKTVSQELQVSMLTTSSLTEQFTMPTCRYTIHRGSPDGPRVRFAVVGDSLYHKWQCDDSASQNLFKMRVHSCFVQGSQGAQVPILDPNGCSIDRYILRNLYYATNMLAHIESHAFKFSDQTSLLFQCQISLCVDLENGCPLTAKTRSQTLSICPLAPRLRRSAMIEEQTLAVDVVSDWVEVAQMEDVFATTRPNLHVNTSIASECVTHLHTNSLFLLSFLCMLSGVVLLSSCTVKKSR